MKAALAVGFAVVIGALVAWRLMRSPARSENTYRMLREQALAVEADKIGIVPTQGRAWGAVMDFWVSDTTVSVVAFADGSASIYLGNGGGFLGGQGHETIRAAAKNLVEAATRALPA